MKIMKILRTKLAKTCPSCGSKDTHRSRLRSGYTHKCNECGDYFGIRFLEFG